MLTWNSMSMSANPCSTASFLRKAHTAIGSLLWARISRSLLRTKGMPPGRMPSPQNPTLRPKKRAQVCCLAVKLLHCKEHMKLHQGTIHHVGVLACPEPKKVSRSDLHVFCGGIQQPHVVICCDHHSRFSVSSRCGAQPGNSGIDF